MKWCYGCFNKIDDPVQVCPYCGYRKGISADSDWILPPGTILNGKYEIGRCLGEGGFGITYLAWDRNMETRIAIKEYFPTNAVSRNVMSPKGNLVIQNATYGAQNFDEGLQRYVKEASILSKFFELPGIVTVKDFFYENDTAYYVMEYIEGMSLRDYLEARGGTIGYEEALALVQPVISSLNVIHQNSLLHRDISPDNIMISNEGTIKLIDFGAARSMEQAQDNGMTVMLKHGYAPIEQYSRNGPQGPYTDVYGVCAVLYKMITGYVPVDATDRATKGDSGSDLLVPIRKIRRRVPKHISNAIEKGLSILPEKRQQNMQELYDELFISRKGVVEKTVDSAYSVLIRILVVFALILGMVAVFGIFYRANYDRFDNIRKAFYALTGNDNDLTDADDAGNLDNDNTQHADYNEDNSDETLNDHSDETRSASDNTDINEDDQNRELNSDTSSRADDTSNDDRSQVDSSETEDQPFIADKSDGNELHSAKNDEELDTAIEAVQKGVLDSGNVPVGDLLDSYSDTPGIWEGYRDENNKMYVKYTGSKEGKSFAVIFEITTKQSSSSQLYISFRVAGALQDGNRVDDHNAFFKQIVEGI